MKATHLGRLAGFAAATIFAAQVWGQQQAIHDADAAEAGTSTATVPVQREIVVSLKDRKLALIENGQVTKIYSVAVGKSSTPSPEGTFTIERRVANPVYHHDGTTVLPGPGNPVGTRWMGLNKRGYGIHGTNEPRSIGKAASHGCIRMAQKDLEEFYAMVRVGDTVRLVGQRDDETAQLFGAGVKPGATANPAANAAQVAGNERPAAPPEVMPAAAPLATEAASANPAPAAAAKSVASVGTR
jgi:hypothetical protein